MDTQNFQRRIVLKLKLPRELHAADLTKSLKPRWATKARTPRIPVVSGSDQNKPQVLIDSEKVIIGFADDDSGNLKRKFEEINPSGSSWGGDQKTDSGVVSEGELIRESEIKINDDHIKNLQQVVSEKVIMIWFADDSGNLKLETDQRIQETSDSWVVSDHADDQGEIKESEIKNLQVVSSASVNENDASMAPKTPKRYACSMCSKTFSSHQALGGHKSSHYKFTMKIYDAIDDLRPKKQLLISTTTTCHQQIGDDRTHYTCKICFKTFPSGQALGGHQRRHWTGNMKKTQSAPKILDFDLNELPKEEDHEDLCAKSC